MEFEKEIRSAYALHFVLLDVTGEQMNRFLNENWKDVQNELSPTISESFKRVVNSIVDNICSQVPYEEIFKKN